jgi:hypothetical protein
MPERLLTAKEICWGLGSRGNSIYYLIRSGRLLPDAIVADHAAFRPNRLREILDKLAPHMSAVEYARAYRKLETQASTTALQIT